MTWTQLVALVECNVDLTLVGPHIDNQPWTTYSVALNKNRQATLRIRQIRGVVQDVILCAGKSDNDDDDDHDMDIFVAFQPGAGTNVVHYSWAAGFEAIRDTGKPLLLTAYNAKDADRDVYWWHCTFDEHLPPYRSNPWASLAMTSAPEFDDDETFITTLNGVVTIYKGGHDEHCGQDEL